MKPPVNIKWRSINEAIFLGGICVLLFVADVMDGGRFWSQWAIGLIAFIWIMRAAPLFARGWFRPLHVRLLAIIAGLARINAYSWNGQLWVIWPGGILLLVILMGMLRARPH